MPRPTHELHFDFETYCDLDLTKAGLYRYVAHASFKVLCVAWKLDSRSPRSMIVLQHNLPAELVAALQSPDVQGHAFNAAFETAVLAQLGIIPAHPLSCTMQRAFAYGLPGKLETATAALGLAQQKDMTGYRLMRQMTRPLKPGKPAWAAEDYERLADYCAKDVEAEAALAAVIPELPLEEAELSALDAAMNTAGELGIDRDRVCTLQCIAEAAEKLNAARAAELTGGAVTSPGTQHERIQAWLAGQGVALEGVARATVEETLAGENLSSEVRKVLQIRLWAARASNHKLKSMLAMSDPASLALRGQFQFCGAGRTGRWSGRGVQVQNLPRVPKQFSPELFYNLAQVGGEQLDAIAPAPVLDCVSWSLRSCLKATSNNHVLWSFDFSQIEARVLAWLAGERDVLAVFASGEDVYVWTAAQVGSHDRQLGKVLALALGYGMGAKKLQETAWKAYQVRLTSEAAETFKTLWRARNGHIVGFWAEIEFAAKQALLRRGTVFAAGGSGVAFTATAKTLQMRLPSGRVLYYHGARLDHDSGNIVYMGTELGRWMEQRTWGGKLAENATQAVARDIMAEAMLRAWRRIGLVPCMTVHDELVYTIDRGAHGWSHLEQIMLEAPPWAGGLPLDGEHKLMHRYGVQMSFEAVAKAA